MHIFGLSDILSLKSLIIIYGSESQTYDEFIALNVNEWMIDNHLMFNKQYYLDIPERLSISIFDQILAVDIFCVKQATKFNLSLHVFNYFV